MNVISRTRLKLFWETHPQSEGPLTAWLAVVGRAAWKRPQDVRDDFNSADFLTDKRVVFNIAGNKYRIVARISFEYKNLMIKFVGSHAEYDKIDAEIV